MRTTLELPDPLFVRLKARAALERITLKQLLTVFVERGLAQRESASSTAGRRSTGLPRISEPIAIDPDHLSNARLFELIEE